MTEHADEQDEKATKAEEPSSTKRWALTYAAALFASLCLVALLTGSLTGSWHNAALLSGATLLSFLIASRFASDESKLPLSALSSILTAALGGGALIYGVGQTAAHQLIRHTLFFVGVGLAALILAWCVVPHLFPRKRANTEKEETPQDRDTRSTRNTLLAFCYVGVVGVTLYGLQPVVPFSYAALLRILGAGILISCCALLTGALFGFLFGIPRAQQLTPPAASGAGGEADANRKPSPYLVNTNLEQISDWLTKIVVGLGLVNLAVIPARVASVANYFARGLGDVEGRESVALALLVLFSACGFLLGYLLTRLFLTGAFSRAQELPANQLSKALKDVGERSTTPTAEPKEQRLADIKTLDRLAAKVSRSVLHDQVRDLASEYQATRASMSFSAERTRRLDGIVVRMQGLALHAYDMLPELMSSSFEGERLAAIAFLQMHPDEKSLVWLVQRFSGETAFLQYHAALALKKGVDGLNPASWRALESSVVEALALLPPGRSDSATRSILSQTLTELRERRGEE